MAISLDAGARASRLEAVVSGAPTTPAGPVIDPRLVPVKVLELELAGPMVRAAGDPDGRESPRAADASGRILALVRMHGQPLGVVQAEVPAAGQAPGVLVGTARTQLAREIAEHEQLDHAPLNLVERGAAGVLPCRARRLRTLALAPLISVVIATRERPESLARCLASVARLDYPRFEVIVVDNAPETSDTERLVRRRYPGRVLYVRERLRGLAAAHNRGLAQAHGQIVALTDDDVLVDRDWLAAIAEAFQADERVGCVTGLIAPAELETPAQAMLETRGRFVKGFAPRRFELGAPDGDPLFPFTVARVGSGANMAFRTEVLSRIGGFDRATGAGSVARGGDDLLAFLRTLTSGYAVSYQPGSLVWHHHRRTTEAVARQAYDYGAGLSAFLTAAIAHEPGLLFAFVRRLPRGTIQAARLVRSGAGDDGWPAGLAAQQCRGMLYGPLAYARSRWQTRDAAQPPLMAGSTQAASR